MVYFSGSFCVHVPGAFKVAFLFKRAQKRVNCAGSEVDAEAFTDAGDYLVAVHRLLVEVLEDYHVKESFGEFSLDFFLVVVGHFVGLSPCVVVLYGCTICLF